MAHNDVDFRNDCKGDARIPRFAECVIYLPADDFMTRALAEGLFFA